MRPNTPNRKAKYDFGLKEGEGVLRERASAGESRSQVSLAYIQVDVYVCKKVSERG